MTEPLYIVGTGAVTCLGFNAPASCAAVRAALDGFALTGTRDQVRGPSVAAEVPLTQPALDVNPFSRLVALGGAALYECAAAVEPLPARCAVLLSVREPYRKSASNAWRSASLLRELVAASGLDPHPDSGELEAGHAGALACLIRARYLLSSKRADVCFVGGVDSYLNGPDLALLGGAYRLKSEHVVHGFVPGEGAAFVALSLKPRASARARVLGVGTADEQPDACVISNAGFPEGRGLANAIAGACQEAGLPESAIEFRLSDMNGEAFRVRENMFATTRAYRTRREEFPQFYPAANVGDLGAAASPFLLVLGAAAFQRGYAPGRIAMCESASDTGLRAACVLADVT